MSSSASPRNPSVARGWAAAWPRDIPVWTILLFSGAIALAYSPNILHPSGIHSSYDTLIYKSRGVFHTEAKHLLQLGRPVAALLSNLLVWPVESMADYRWTRLFSVLTVCVIGTQIIANCVGRLRARPQDAVIVAIAVFLVPAFTYSILEAAAWAPYLLSIMLAVTAYSVLGRSNLQSIPFLLLATQRDTRGLVRQAFAYCGFRPVLTACVIFQVALYDYPPNALILALFPVIGILFSQTPRAYRTLIALRDIVFIGANLLIYFLSAKLFYLPIIRQITKVEINTQTAEALSPFAARVGNTYAFELVTHPFAIWERLGNLMRVAGDLWFLPQAHIHVLSGGVVFLAIVLATGATMLACLRTSPWPGQPHENTTRLSMDTWHSEGVFATLVLAVCFVISGSATLLSVGGLLSYRAITIPTALASISVIYGAGVVARAIWNAFGSPLCSASRFADVVMALIAVSAVTAIFYMGDSIRKLSRNEFAYFSGIARQAIDAKSKTIILIDPRPLFLPEDVPTASDERDRWLPPYELGCFSGYCLPTTGILRVALSELGHPANEFNLLSTREDDPVPGLTCEMLTALVPSYPPNASAQSIETIKHWRALAPVTCVTYSLAWHDLGADPVR